MQQAPACQAVDAETKRLNALSAQLGRLCTPKPKSGKLDVPQEIYEQWKKAGEPRKLLLSTLIAANGDKERNDSKHFQTQNHQNKPKTDGQAVFKKKIELQLQMSRKRTMTVEAGFYSKKDMKEVLGWSAPGSYSMLM